jgi:dihydrofolate reductase
LPGRTNIVITRDPDFVARGAVVTRSLADALAVARGDALRRSVAEIAVIGGAEIYAASMPVADCLEVTEVHAEVDGDAVFPAIDPSVWREAGRSRNSPSDAALTAFRDACIDNFLFGYSSLQPTSRVVRVVSVPYKVELTA